MKRCVDGSGCALAAALLAQLIECGPKLVKLLRERGSRGVMQEAAAIASTLAKGHFLDGNGLGNASQRAGLKSLVVVRHGGDMRSRADRSATSGAEGTMVGSASGIVGTSWSVVGAKAEGASLLRCAVDLDSGVS